MTKKILQKGKPKLLNLELKLQQSNAQFTAKLLAKSWENLDTKLENIYIYGKAGHNWDPKVDRTKMLQFFFFFLRSQPRSPGGKFIEK